MLILIFALLLAACAPLTPVSLPVTATPLPPTTTPWPTETFTPPATLTPAPSPTPAPTPDPEAPLLQFPAWALIHDLAWSPDGARLAVSAGTDIFLYTGTQRELTLPVGAWAERIAFHPSRPILAAAVRDGSLRFWDSASGAELCRFSAHLKGASSLSFHPGGEWLASTGNDIVSHIWDISSVLAGGCDVKESAALIGASYSASDVVFSADGQFLALVDTRNIRLRESANRKLIATLKGDLPIFDLALSPDGRWLAAAQDNATFTLWDLADKPKALATALRMESAGAGAYGWRVDFSPDNGSLAGGASDGTLTVWELDSLRPVLIRHLPGAISALAFNPQDGRLAIGQLDGAVYIWPGP